MMANIDIIGSGKIGGMRKAWEALCGINATFSSRHSAFTYQSAFQLADSFNHITHSDPDSGTVIHG